MGLIEKSFPRGGKIQKQKQTDNKKEKIIFGAVQNKMKKSKSHKKSKNLNSDDVDLDALLEETKEDNIESITADLLSYSTIQDGMNIMGKVIGIEQLYLKLSLPGKMTARVTALEISDSYTKATKEFLESPTAGQIENYKPLKDLYHIGQIVYGRVQELKNFDNGRVIINMTLKPTEVHSELVHVNVKKAFIFYGAVEEVLEHGYIIETGIKGLRAFLPLENAKIGVHSVGELLPLKVERITHDKAVSTATCRELQEENFRIKNFTDPILDYILPSSIIKFTITKQLKDGLQGTIFNDAFTAYVNEHQLAEPLALPEDYEVNTTLMARVLYVMPLTKLVYLTLNTGKSSMIDDDAIALKRGTIVENAKVHHIGTGGIIFVLNNKYKGIISFKTIKANYKGNYDQDALMIKYAKKTTHKVRILDYDLMDTLYICTDDTSLVEEKYFDINDIESGQMVTAVVKGFNAARNVYKMQIGKIRGIIEKLYLSPATRTLEEGTKVRCRVINVSEDRQRVYLTNRSEYLSKNCHILKSLQDANVKSIFTGTVVLCKEAYILVKFFNDIKGVLHRQISNSDENDVATKDVDDFYVGQTMTFRITSKNDEQIQLGLPDSVYSMGEICPVTVSDTLDSGLEIKISSNPTTIKKDNDNDDDENVAEGTSNNLEIKGLIPIRLFSDFPDLQLAKLRIYPVETEIKAACIDKNIFSLREVDYFEREPIKEFRFIKVGDILKASVKNVTDETVDLWIPILGLTKVVKVPLKSFLFDAFRKPNVTLTLEQVVYVKVIGRERTTKTIRVTAKLNDVWDCQMSSTAKFFESYLQEVNQIKEKLKTLKNHPIGKYSIGEKVKAQFQGVRNETGDWQYELGKKLKLTGIVKASLVGNVKPPVIGHSQECIILWIDYSNELIYLSNKQGDLSHITAVNELPTNLVRQSGINAKVLLKDENLFICSLKKGPNPLVFCPTRLHFNDFDYSNGIQVKEGDFCKLTFIHGTVPIAVLDNTVKLWREYNRKRKAEIDSYVDKIEAKKMKLLEKQNEIKIEIKNEVRQQATLVDSSNENNIEGPSSTNKSQDKGEDTLYYEDKDPDSAEIVKMAASKMKLKKRIAENLLAKQLENAKKEKKLQTNCLPSVNDFWTTDLSELNKDAKESEVSSDDDDDDDDDDNAETTNQKKRKLTTVEKFKKQREEEARLRDIEEKNADPNHMPENVDQFDRLVLSEPNVSQHWINYMAYHLQSTEIDKARAVARRAIKSITFRENEEQLNMWVALLNLELRYGTKESFDETFKEALTYNESVKVYLRTVEILIGANRTQELTELVGIMTRKFKTIVDVWKAAANAYFSCNLIEKAQQLLHKALSSLPEREHVNTIVLFANLNHRYQQNEMAQTLMDQVVTSYPKRVDVWSQYVDMLVKENLIDSARNVLERAVIQRIPLKKMRTIFKKYLEFEQSYGTEDSVEKVKQLAVEYVKNTTEL